jgi:hypothetical protein
MSEIRATFESMTEIWATFFTLKVKKVGKKFYPWVSNTDRHHLIPRRLPVICSDFKLVENFL